MKIYNIAGRELYSLSDYFTSGSRVLIKWDGRDYNGVPLPSGIYFLELSNGWERETIKMEILR